MLQLTVSLFIFSRELLRLHKLPGATDRRRIHIDLVLRGLQGELLYLFSFFLEEFVDPVERCLIAVSVRVAAQALETFLDEVPPRISASGDSRPTYK